MPDEDLSGRRIVRFDSQRAQDEFFARRVAEPQGRINETKAHLDSLDEAKRRRQARRWVPPTAIGLTGLSLLMSLALWWWPAAWWLNAWLVCAVAGAGLATWATISTSRRRP